MPQNENTPSIETSNLSSGTFSDISNRLGKAYLRAALLFGFAVLGTAIHLLIVESSYLIPFILTELPCFLLLFLWAKKPEKGIPFIPLFILQQAVIYGLPIAVRNLGPYPISPQSLNFSALSIALFTSFVGIGWHFGSSMATRSATSRWPLYLADSLKTKKRGQFLAILLLFSGLLLRILNVSGLLVSLLPKSLISLVPVALNLAEAGAMLGALIGGITIAQTFRTGICWLYWTLITLTFLVLVSDILLSSATGLLGATAMGLAMGSRRLPWKFILVSISIVAFLNHGKVEMRDKYWGVETNRVDIPVAQMPSFFLDWLSTSSTTLFNQPSNNSLTSLPTSANTSDGQSLFERINNLQNLAFVTQAIQEQNISPLYGETYAIIPPLLVPRVLWKEKPRTHEGQVLLNLHFRRQLTRNETENTYIAWGLLPEATGNFGIFGGPMILGMTLGLIFGIVERISLNKRIFSIEGLILVACLLKLAVSYEMVSSVFITSTFQFVACVLLAGLLMKVYLGSAPPTAETETSKLPSPSR